MDDLVAWLRAQLNEDERVVREVSPDFDLFDGTGVVVMRTHIPAHSRSITLPSSVAAFVACWDPARVLREVEAKRRELDRHGCLVLTYWPVPMCQRCPDYDTEPRPDPLGSDQLWRPNEQWPCMTVRLLAQPYADRPGYREEWRPT